MNCVLEIIHLQHPHHLVREQLPPLSMALGYFDGMHLGHQKVIMTAKRIADELGVKSAVMTFDPHPSVVLGKKAAHVDMITPLEEKARLLKERGIDFLYVVRFDRDFSNLNPEEFVEQYIVNLNVKHVVAGFDFSYGKFGSGTMETMKEHAKDKCEYTVVEKLEDEGEKVSSTLIRKFLQEGRVENIQKLLGRCYTITGRVVHGEKRGREIGFPTANVGEVDGYIIPRTGVYAVELGINGQFYEGVCNIGYKPTFHDKKPEKPTIEVHIFDFKNMIYNEKVVVKWHKLIRKERKFSGIEALVAQINQDKREAAAYFASLKSDA